VCLDQTWFFNSARTGFGYLLKSLDLTDTKILLPAYIGITDREGSGVMDPIWEAGIDYGFYAVDGRLRVDTAELTAKLESGQYGAVLLIHYFGFPQPDTDAIKTVCEAQGSTLIEDCAHALFSCLDDRDLGSIGDFGFYSIHKSSPAESGGILRANRTGFELSSSTGDEDQIEVDDLAIFSRLNRNEVARRSRANYLTLASLLNDCAALEIMYPELPVGVVPLNFPVLVKHELREPLYFHLMEQGMPTIALYYRLIDDLNGDKYATSNQVSSRILNLPVHQDVTEQDLVALSKEIHAFFASDIARKAEHG
jgi:dTDP-4-amino-4,6-dideoxygalactose transaminase